LNPFIMVKEIFGFLREIASWKNTFTGVGLGEVELD